MPKFLGFRMQGFEDLEVSRKSWLPIWGVPYNYNKGYSILGSILGSSYFGELPFGAQV